MEYSAISPCHNEAKNIPGLVQGLMQQLKKTGKSFEIIIVNDNSTDNSEKVLEELKKKFKELKPLNRHSNPGVGNALKEGFSNAKGKYLITLDGDLSHDPEDLPKLLEGIKDCDLVAGSRLIEKGKADMPLSRKIISKTFNFMFRKVLGIKIRDFTSGYRVIRKKLLEEISPLESKGFGIFIEIPIKASRKKFKFKEVPIYYKKRFAGESNLGYFRQGPEYVKVGLKALEQRILGERK